MHKRVSAGFTLIELLVVVAIIAILAAILFPVFARARAKARQVMCSSNQRQIAVAVVAYSSDYDEIMPLVEGIVRTGTGYTIRYTWRWGLYPYVKNTQIYACPEQAQSGPFAYPDEGAEFPSSYIAPAFTYLTRPGTRAAWSHFIPGTPVFQTVPLAAIEVPSETAVLLDGGKESHPGWVDLGGTWEDNTPYAPTPDVIRDETVHHSGRVNLAYCDGHVKSVTVDVARDPSLWSIAAD